MRWQDKHKHKLISAKQAAQLVTSDSEVLFSMMNQPKDIGLQLANRYSELKNVTLTSHWVDDYPFLHMDEHPEMSEAFLIKDAFPLRYTRKGIRDKCIDWKPSIFGLSDGIRQLDTNRGKLYHFKDFFFFKLAQPDSAGECSFGHQPWYSPSACRTAKVKIAEIDPGLPRVYGEHVNIEHLDYLVEAPWGNGAKAEDHVPIPSPTDWEIAQVIATNASSLIKDGDTLEIGTGTATEAVVDFLFDKNDLGIDSELIFRQMIDLVKRGNITGKGKSNDQGKVVCGSFRTYGTDPQLREALEFITENPSFEFRDISYICNIPRIAAQQNMVTLNAALAIDLLGQVVTTHIGPVPISSPGGAVEYCIGSHYSRNGRAAFLLNSTALGGKVSRIVPRLEPGTAVMIPMVYVDYLVTEYGIANLECKSCRERAEELIRVAHPDFREELQREARKLFYP